ncbi:hypothetical protein D3C80_2114170 [compost metagenome]
MLYDFADFFIVARQIDYIRVLLFDPCQHGLEVGVLLLIGFLAQHLSALFLESLFKELLQALGIVTRRVCVNYCCFGF